MTSPEFTKDIASLLADLHIYSKNSRRSVDKPFDTKQSVSSQSARPLSIRLNTMPRPEGSVNVKPTKNDIILMLKDKGIDCKNGGIAFKKSELETMAKDAGIDIYAAKNAITAKRPGSSIEACMVTLYGSNSSRNTNTSLRPDKQAVAILDALDEEDVPLNQEGINATPSVPIVVRQPFWSMELTVYGYTTIGRPAPNQAVQTVLTCILRKELHQYIIDKEKSIHNHDHSAIIHLGMSNFLTLVSGFTAAGYDMQACKDLIDIKYARLPTAQFFATERETANLRMFVRVLTALEKANGVKYTYPVDNNRRIRARAPAPQVMVVPNTAHSNCLFNVDMLPDEYKAAFDSSSNNEVNNAAEEEEDDRVPITMLNLFNCGRFPIMTQREVEAHGSQFKNALWKSKNLGIIAPISVDAWKKLANIGDDEVKEAFKDADNFIRRVERIEITLPIPAKCLGLECSNSKTICIGQKGHQARVEERRHDFYIKKMWRTFCPFIKCTCSKAAKESGECSDSILWLDHAIWYLMNNLENAWPTYPTVVRFGFFCSILSTKPLQTAITAFLGYLKVRDTLIKMAVLYSEDPNRDLNLEFGNTKLSDILEKTIKPIKFLTGKQQEAANSSQNESNRKRQNEPASPDCSIIMPPRLYKRPESSNATTSGGMNNNTVIEIEDTCLTGRSVNNAAGAPARSFDISPRDFGI